MPVTLRPYRSEEEESEVAAIAKLVSKDLSEPYSVYVYLYFLKEWPGLSFMAVDGDKVIGTIVCSLRAHHERRLRGYIAMLAVDEEYRGHGYAKQLIKAAVENLKAKGADEITLEAEVTNVAALSLYQNMGFIRAKRYHRYYLNTSDAFRLILPLTEKSTISLAFLEPTVDTAAVQKLQQLSIA